ncbi:MAG: nitroreductase [Chloroflexia bacterium]
MHDLLYRPWDVSESDFPTEGKASDKLRFLINYAVLAPSSHNSQPWLFDISGDTLTLYADRTRVLPVMDPHDRELVISCGAALALLRISMHHFGFADSVQTFPDPERPDLLARVNLTAGHDPTPEDDLLFGAILKRHTNRRPYDSRQVPNQVVAELEAAADSEGAQLITVDEEDARNALALLIAEADRLQWSDKRFRNELAAWVRPNISVSYDGIQSDALDYGEFTSYTVPQIMRTFDLGNGQAAKDLELASGSPLLVVLATPTDTPTAWLAAGQALAKVLLHTASEGLSASYLNQPIEIASLRKKVQNVTGCDLYPQLVLRMGYGPEVSPTTRRSADTVII